MSSRLARLVGDALYIIAVGLTVKVMLDILGKNLVIAVPPIFEEVAKTVEVHVLGETLELVADIGEICKKYDRVKAVVYKKGSSVAGIELYSPDGKKVFGAELHVPEGSVIAELGKPEVRNCILTFNLKTRKVV